MAGPWEKYGTAPNLTSEKVDEEFANKVEQEKETYDTQVKDTTTSKVNMFGNEYQIPSFFTSPAGAVLAGGAAALTGMGAAKAASKAYTSISDRLMKKPEIDRTVDVQMDKSLPKTFSPPTNVGPVTNFPGTPQELEKALGPDWEAKIAKSDAIRKERQALAQQNARVAMGELTSPTPAVPVPAPQPPAPSPVAQVAAQTAPVAPPTVAQIAQQAAPAVAEAAQAPVEAIPPAEKNKGGRPKGVKTATAEERAAKEAAKGINMYRNMFGFEAKDPTSAKSLAAIEATNRLIAEGYEGKIPASRDPFLNPATDVGASGKKFYSGTPEGYRNVYIPWLEKNLNTLPPETQAHVLESMTKGQTKDIGKIIKGLGLAGAALGAYDTAFAKTPGQRGMAGANVLGAVLPPGADITEAGAPVLPPNILAAQQRQLEEMQKLGSPYRKR